MKANSVKQNPLTTIAGIIIVAIVPLLSFFGIIHPQDMTQVQSYIGQVFAAIQSHFWVLLITAIGGLSLIFFGYDSLNWKDIWNNIIKNPKTTIIGIVTLALIPILVYFGLLNASIQTDLNNSITDLITAIFSHNWEIVITSLMGIISLLFAKDKSV